MEDLHLLRLQDSYDLLHREAEDCCLYLGE